MGILEGGEENHRRRDARRMTSADVPQPTRLRRIFDPDARFVDPRLQRTCALWQETARDAPHRLPDRGAFGLETLHELQVLTRTMMMDVVDGGARFRYRLIGTALTTLAERDVTGRFLDEVYPRDVYEKFKGTLDWVIRERRPARAMDTFKFRDKEYIGYEALVAPLAQGGGGDVAIILVVAIDFAPPE